MIRSFFAILGGFITTVALSLGTDIIMMQFFPEMRPPARRTLGVGLQLFTNFYVFVFGIAGCFVAALLAPRAPMRHALMLGVVAFVLSAIIVGMTWNKVPAWSQLLTLLLIPVAAWIGGRWGERISAAKAAAPEAEGQ